MLNVIFYGHELLLKVCSYGHELQLYFNVHD